MTRIDGTPLHLAMLALGLAFTAATAPTTRAGASTGTAAPATNPATAPAAAPAPAPAPAPRVELKVVTEDKRKEIQATVTLNGKALENITVSFFVKRRFGNMAIGQDKTLDDGTADVPIPANLPAGPTGRLEVFATTSATAQYAQGRGQASLEGAPMAASEPEVFPRALWAPRAPALLVLTILAILVAVWTCYAYVVAQLIAIFRNK